MNIDRSCRAAEPTDRQSARASIVRNVHRLCCECISSTRRWCDYNCQRRLGQHFHYNRKTDTIERRQVNRLDRRSNRLSKVRNEILEKNPREKSIRTEFVRRNDVFSNAPK